MARMIIVLFTICISRMISFPFLVEGQVMDGAIGDGEYPFTRVYDDGHYRLAWSVKGDIGYIAISADTTGWVAVAFDPVTLMEGADMISGWVDATGNAHAVDTYATGPYGPHPPDVELGGTDDLLEFAGTEVNGVTTIEFSRKLNTNDKYDKVLLGPNGNAVIWAYGDSDEYTKYHKKSGYGSMGAGERRGPAKGFGWLLVFHNIALTAAFMLMIFAMLVARYMKKKRWWLKAHRRMELTGVVLSVLGIVSVEYLIIATVGSHFRITHSYLGAVAIVFLISAPVLGRLYLKVKANRKPFFKMFHRWVGRIALLLTLAAVVYGLLQIQII